MFKMGSIKFIITLLVTTLTVQINAQFNSHCPPPDLLHPCYCKQERPVIPEVIYCGGNTPIKLKTIFTKLATNLTEKERDYPVLYLNNTAITELSENTFGDIGFGTIYIRGAHNLKTIHLDAFKGRTGSVTSEVEIVNNPSLENNNGSLLYALTKLVKLYSLKIENNNKITEIPDNAFQNGNEKLTALTFSGKSIVRLGENAFKKSPNLRQLSILNTRISRIPNEAFVVDRPTMQSMALTMYGNKLITGDSFAPRSLVNIKRMTQLMLSMPYARAENLTFLDKNAFLPFLEADANNELIINDRSFNCSDSRNQWLIESKYLSKVKFTHCKPKTNQTEEYHTEWQLFKTKFGKIYSDSTEELKRKHIFVDNLKRINSHNIEFQNRLKTYELGINQFADFTLDEIRAKTMTGFIGKAYFSSEYSSEFSLNGSVPDHIDWRDKNIVTSIKDQIVEKCGSCWAQAAAATIEGQIALKYGRLVSLSVQNLVDCSTKYGNLGCHGGFTDWGYDYIVENGGIATEDSYPYKAKDQECQFSNKTISARITGYVDLPPKDETALKKAVALIGPIAVPLDTKGFGFYYYKSGVYFDELCGEEIQDAIHVMTAIGYGTTSEGQDYWLLKNSMGTDWGEKGFVKWARNRNNMCGVATSPSYPIGVQ